MYKIIIALVLLSSCATEYVNINPYKPNKRDGRERVLKTGDYFDNGRVHKKFSLTH